LARTDIKKAAGQDARQKGFWQQVVTQKINLKNNGWFLVFPLFLIGGAGTKKINQRG
jgi:hypothetical protein